MKKLLFTMGCLTAMIVMNSCTSDSVEETKNKNLKNPNQISSPAGGNNNVSAIDDKNPLKP